MTQVGSDSSYDLIVSGNKMSSGEIEINFLDPDMKERFQKYHTSLIEDYETKIKEMPFSLTIQVFERIPNDFVIKARIEACIEQMRMS